MKNQKESIDLDFILTFLKLNKDSHFDTKEIAKIIENDFDITFALCERLKEKGLIRYKDTSSSSGMDQMISHHPKGTAFLSKGGFRAIYNKENIKAKIAKEIQILQLTELRKKVEVMDKQIKEQSDFHKTSIQRNKEQLKYLKDQQLIIWVMLGLTMLGLILKIFFN